MFIKHTILQRKHYWIRKSSDDGTTEMLHNIKRTWHLKTMLDVSELFAKKICVKLSYFAILIFYRKNFNEQRTLFEKKMRQANY